MEFPWSLVFLVTFTTVLAMVLVTAEAQVQCLECTSEGNTKCLDEDDDGNKFNAADIDDICEGKFCYKQKKEDLTIRGCYMGEDPEDLKECEKRDDGKMCYCKGNKCNAANHVTTSAVPVLLLGAAIVYYNAQ